MLYMNLRTIYKYRNIISRAFIDRKPVFFHQPESLIQADLQSTLLNTKCDKKAQVACQLQCERAFKLSQVNTETFNLYKIEEIMNLHFDLQLRHRHFFF